MRTLWGPRQDLSRTDKSHSDLHKANTTSVSQWQITPNFAQANTQCHTPICTGHTQRQSIRLITTHSAQGKHSVGQPMTNHTLIGLSFQSFFIFHVLFWGCHFCYWCWWPHLCTYLFFNSASKQHSVQGYNGSVLFPNYGRHVHVGRSAEAKYKCHRNKKITLPIWSASTWLTRETARAWLGRRSCQLVSFCNKRVIL